MSKNRSNQIKMIPLFLALCWLSSCALHQTGADKFAEGSLSEEPDSAEKVSVRGPVVLKLISETDKEEAILTKTQKYHANTKTGLTHPAKIEKAMNLQGLVGIKVGTLPAMIQEIEKNRPVTFLRKTKDGNYRYQLLVGAELRDEILIVKDRGKMERLSFSDFFNSWRAGRFWARSFVKPAMILPTEADEAFQEGLALEASRPLHARRIFKKVAGLKDEKAEYLIAWANNVANRNKRKAIELLRRAVSVEPNNFQAWYNLAAMQSLSGRKKEAAATSKKILAMFEWRAPKSRLNILRSLAAK